MHATLEQALLWRLKSRAYDAYWNETSTVNAPSVRKLALNITNAKLHFHMKVKSVHEMFWIYGNLENYKPSSSPCIHHSAEELLTESYAGFLRHLAIFLNPFSHSSHHTWSRAGRYGQKFISLYFLADLRYMVYISIFSFSYQDFFFFICI